MARFLKRLALILVALLAVGFAAGYTPDSDPEAMKAKYAYGTSKFVALSPGLNVHYRDEGKTDGPALVLIHGSNASLHTWEEWSKRLGDTYRVISLDLPGHGLTGVDPSGNYNPDRYAEVVDQLLTRLAVPRAIIAGNSMGGYVSIRYALKHPKKTAALVLLDSSGAPSKPKTDLPIGFRIMQTPGLRNLSLYISPRSLFDKSVRESMAVQTVVTDAMVDRYWELNRVPGNRAATLWRFQNYNRTSQSDQIAQIKAPTLILWGEKDTVIPVADAAWLGKTIQGSKVITYPNVGHIPMEEIPNQTTNDVRTWLASLDGAF
jgi:pimeloyl-ACP methyl ester carboxylesterase